MKVNKTCSITIEVTPKELALIEAMCDFITMNSVSELPFVRLCESMFHEGDLNRISEIGNELGNNGCSS